MSTNPRTISWTNPTERVDGTPYGEGENAGYTLQIDGAEAVSVPLAWGTSFDISSLEAYRALRSGAHSVALAVVSKEGLASDFSTPATFQVAVAPMAPTNLVLAA